MKDNGRAAIVLPTGFLTAQAGIEKAIRQKLIDNNWLKGVVSMPSNIFANTGTNVSVIFIDKTKDDEDNKVILVDASKLGEKRKEGKNQRTVLRDDEVEKIISTFNARESVDDFSVLVTNDDITEKNYSFSAGQYFEVKIDYVELTPEEFQAKMTAFSEELDKLFEESGKLEKEIKEQMGKIKYE